MTKLALLGAAALLAALAAIPSTGHACGFGDEACPVVLAANKANAPLSLLPFAQDERKSAKPRSKKKKSSRARDKDRDDKAQEQLQAAETADGVAAGTFAAAAHYMIVPPDYNPADATITVVSENELSEIDLLAGKVRVVEPGDANEIDLAVDQEARVAHAEQAEGNGNADDGDIFNRVLITFAGALAAASAMRIFIA